MALVLMIGSGLLLRTAARLYRVHPGLVIENLLTAGVSVGARDRERAVVSYHRILDEVAGLPGVTSVGAANILPFEATRMSGSSVGLRSHSPAHTDIRPIARYKAVTTGYFETLRMPILEGRAPVRADAGHNRPVAWVNETFVRELLAERTLGERLTVEGRALEIVGVVGDVREFGLREEVRPTAYLPPGVIPSVGHGIMYVVARTATAVAPSASAIRAAVDRADPSVPMTTVRTMDQIVGASLAPMRFTMTLLVIAATVALLLAIIGLYAVTRYIVSQGTRGVRLALGAAATYLSTRRATQVDPVVALRSE